MSLINKIISHILEKNEALVKVKNLLGDAKIKYAELVSEPTEEWNEDVCNFSFKTYGAVIKGTMQVEENNVTISAEIPFWMKPFAARIEEVFEKQAKELLAK